MSEKPFNVNKVAVSMFISDDYFRRPSEEQKERWRAKRLARENHIRVGLEAAPDALRPIIELHGKSEYDECEGCDGGPDHSGDWPCRTIQLIADTYDPAGIQ